MNASSGKRVIVVGAGIAGLVAAHTLAQRGFSVRVLEAATRVGGRMTTDCVDGFVIDRGAQFLSSEYPILLSLAQSLGLEPDLRVSSPWAGIVRNGRLCAVNGSDWLSPWRSGLLSFPEWLGLGARGWKLRATSPRNRALNDYSQWAGCDTESAATWGRRVLGPSATDYLLEPVLEGFYFQEIEATSRALAEVVCGFFNARRGRSLSLAGGLGRLPEALAAMLDVAVSTPVLALEHDGERVVVVTKTARFEADHVILATTASVAGRLHRRADDVEQALLATGYSANLNVAVMTRPDFRLLRGVEKMYGVLIPRRERRHVAAIGIEANKSRDRAAQGHLFNLMLSGRSSREILAWPEPEIVHSILPELERLLPGVTAAVAATHVYRWEEAEPLSPVGRARNLRQYRADVAAAACPRVLLAGDYLSMPFTEGAAESGRWAAQAIARSG